MIEIPDQIDLLDSQSRAAELGARPALIERFGIRNLHNYRSISMNSKNSATILIAKNGTGKTTLMGALDAFLKLQFHRLRGLEFTEIFCKFRGSGDEVVVTHDDILEFLQIPDSTNFARLSSRTSIEPPKLFNFLLGDFDAALDTYYDDDDPSSIVNLIGRGFSSDMQQAKKVCEEAYRSLFTRSRKMSQIRDTIVASLEDHEVVYLPTYRRVELALTDEGGERRPPRSLGSGRRRRPKFRIAASGLHTGDIQFGLSDISERLAQLNEEIMLRSNRGYREISENIIAEMIRGYEVSDEVNLPKPDDLRLFFSRLEYGRRVIGPYYNRISTPDFEKIYSGEGVPSDSRKFLTYFLGKLNNIIEITKEIEQPVGEFIENCNRYLSSTEPSTFKNDEKDHERLYAIDAKALKVDRTDLSVTVESIPARTPISLDALSSGEKQMVSLFAKMYLYPRSHTHKPDSLGWCLLIH